MKKSFAPPGKRELGRLRAQADEIIRKSERYKDLEDRFLRAKADELRYRLKGSETEDDILVEAFALVREAASRVIGMSHYPVQVIGGIVLHEGKIAEMATGEGKTLVATLPAFLNALSGKGVHVVTVNDYLAKRDAELMGRVHEFLGLTVGTVLSGMGTAERKAAYGCDITYVTNHELGFDYLRDNMARTPCDVVLRHLHYALIDEVDSVLIDDARTPLVISGKGRSSLKIYQACDILAKLMTRGDDLEDISKADMMAGRVQELTGDFGLDEKDGRVQLSDAGMERVERFFRIGNIADIENIRILHHMNLALRANYLMRKDVDYIVRDGEVLIIDQGTGRAMEGRRFSDGLHQAIEAKEYVRIREENRTVSSITFQTFFNKYERKSGMTGTGKAEEGELGQIYGMPVVEIPTNRPVARVDREDVMFRTRREKYDAVVEDIEYARSVNRPVLVGTTSVDASEELSGLLGRRGIPHQVLNAKYHEREAAIVAEAGRAGRVTIATNMAGRGTDIKLDDEARAAGGLLVIGTQRHDSRRVDGQLQGRSGRQGDPGESRFYLSLEDELVRLFGGDRIVSAFDALGVSEGEGVKDPGLRKAVERAQRLVEDAGFSQRKNLIKYDEVLNVQRDVIYGQRREVLFGDDVHGIVMRTIRAAAEDAAGILAQVPLEERFQVLSDQFGRVLPGNVIGRVAGLEDGEVAEFLARELSEKCEFVEEAFSDADMLRERERAMLLEAIDERWMDHIDAMDQLREGIRLVSYAKLDPVTEYRNMAYDLFEELKRSIRRDVIEALLRTSDEDDVRRVISARAGDARLGDRPRTWGTDPGHGGQTPDKGDRPR